MTQAEVDNIIDTLIIDNNTMQVSPAKVRAVCKVINARVPTGDASIVTATEPLYFDPFNNNFNISKANSETDGFLSKEDWNTFNEGSGGVTVTEVSGVSGEITVANGTTAPVIGIDPAYTASKADLVGGLVPSSQLPSSIDDVLDGTYINSTTFNNPSNVPYVPMSNAIYVDTTSNITYRWTGTSYVAIGNNLALGETSSTAYRGDRGKTAYDHSQIITGNPHGTRLNDVVSANARTDIPVGFGFAPSANYSVTAAQTGGGGFGAFRATSNAGVDFVRMRNGVGVECDSYMSLGSTANFSGNTTTNLTFTNPVTGRINIGNPNGMTAPLTLSKQYIVVQQAVIPFTGSNNVDHNVMNVSSVINLAGQSNAGGVTRTRQIYINPTLSGFQSNHRYSAFESVVGGVYANTSTPQDSAILQADSTTQGFLPPRMTEANRTAIVSPVEGLMVKQTNNAIGLYVYQSGAWYRLATDSELSTSIVILPDTTVALNVVNQSAYYGLTGTATMASLPPITGNTGNKFTIANKSASIQNLYSNDSVSNDIFVSGVATNTTPIAVGQVLEVFCDGVNWVVTAKN